LMLDQTPDRWAAVLLHPLRLTKRLLRSIICFISSNACTGSFWLSIKSTLNYKVKCI
jgi:hypothetical protein